MAKTEAQLQREWDRFVISERDRRDPDAQLQRKWDRFVSSERDRRDRVTLPSEAKKSPKQLDREIAEALEKPRVGYGLSAIDEDEWSWSVQRLRPGHTTWGSGSETLAEGVEYTKDEAVDGIKKALTSLGIDLKDATRLPF